MTANKNAARFAPGTASNTALHSGHFNPIENLLPRLDNVRETGPNRWVACCPARDDKHPSMTIREMDDGRILVHDFGGCSVHEIVQAVGLTLSDLFPRDPGRHCKPERRPFPAADVLRAIGYESLVVCAAAVTMMSGEPFTQTDRDRLILAASRIQAGLTAAGVQHG